MTAQDKELRELQPIELKPPAWYDRFWAAATRTTPRKIAFVTLLAPVAALLALGGLGPPAPLDRLFGGRTCEGPRGSRARRVELALSTLGPGANQVAITDRRLLFVHQHLFRDPPQLTAEATVQVPSQAAGQDIHIIARAVDNGAHTLSSYRRVILRVS